MRFVPHVLLLFLLLTVAHARVGDTRAQVQARYGRSLPADVTESRAPLLRKSTELIFESNGWRIRCALLLATDGETYVVREDWRRADGGAIDETHIRSFLNELRPSARWTEFPPRLQWTSPDGVVVSAHGDSKAFTVNLPQALKHDAELDALPVHRAPTPAPPARPKNVVKEPAKVSTPSPATTATPKKPADHSALVGGFLVIAVASTVLRLMKTSKRKSRPRSSNEPSKKQETVAAPNQPPKKRTPADLDWQEFELLVGEVYRRQGYQVELCAGLGGDGGIDLILHKDGERIVVQCKKWNSWKIPPKEIREFFGTLIDSGAARGIFVTTQDFSRDARDFAAGKPIELVDGRALRGMMNGTNYAAPGDLLEPEQWAPAFFSASKLIVPICPRCKKEMVLHRTATPFWGCASFPRCDGKREHRLHAPLDESAFAKKAEEIAVAVAN